MPDSLEHNGKSFTLTFTVPVGSWVKVNGEASETLQIYYHTILTPDALQKVLDQLDAEGKDASSLTVEYTNTFSASWNGDSSDGFTATDSAVFDKVVLDKTAQFMQSAGNKVGYTIEMNPYGLDLQKDSNVILLEDSMGAGAEVFIYLENTFKLINMDTGLQMTRSSSASASTYVLKMAEDGKSFELDVPDNTHLKLTYQVKTTQPVGTEAVSLVNNASLAGRSSQEESIQFDVSSAYQSGSFTVKENEAGIRLVKLSSEGSDSANPTFLPGAEFTMTELDATGAAKGAAVTHTTNANGVIEIKQQLEGAIRIFVIEETKAPAGYRLGDEPWKWCYVLLPQGSSMSADEIAELKAKEKVQCEVTVIPAGSFAEDAITNDPCVSVSATKAWVNAEDATTAPAGATVVFTLYADGTATDDTVTLDGTADDAAPTAAGGYESAAWKATFVNLPKYKDGTSEVVVYTVAETAGYKGYTASPAEPVADGGVITNKQDTAKLTVCKNVAKKIPEHLNMPFKFTVTLDDQTINGQYGDMKFINGVAELFLRHDERITAEGLPGGIHYTVTEDPVPGFTVKASGHEGETVQDEAVTAEFTNIFTPEPVTASFPVKKVLEVPEGLEGPERWSYKINVEAKDGAPIAETMTGTVDQDNDTVTFGPFTYTLPGIYTYTVTETGTVDGVINDRAATSGKTVKVTVVDNKDGTLTATADSTDDKPLTFTNAYVVKYVEASFPVKKVLEVPEGLTGPATWSYTINVAAEDGVPVAETMTATVTNASPTATFGPFEYDVPGTYTYTVTETGTVAGVTNDTTASKTVTVTVEDNGDGTLTATADSTDDEPLTFTNTYGVESVEASFPVKKVLTIPEGLTGPEEWSYTIKVEAKDGAPEAETMTGTVNQDNDTVTFGPFEYDVPGTYTYTVTETGTIDGVTNDTTASKTVTVSAVDNKDGTLTATADSTDDEPLTFTNTYKAGSVTASFPVKKVLEVPEGLTAGDITGKFTFTLTAAEGTPIPAVTEYTNPDADGGVVTFGEITYTLPGTYTYTVTESGTVAGITNDAEATKTVTVTVVDNKDGTLTATADSTDDEPLTFTNTYGVESVEASFPVKKVLTIPEGLTGPEEWSYTINVEAKDGAPEAETMTGTVNQDNDTVTFGPFEYDVPGTYTYTVTETGTVAGVTNDTAASKTVKVTVVDNKDGTLTATASSTADKPLTFTNTYNAKPVELALQVEKRIIGRALAEGEFSFKLQDQASGETLTARNDADGKVVFPAIKYAEAGEYTHTISETQGTLSGVTYDTHTVTAVVTVADNGKGELAAMVEYTGETTFRNTYAAANDLLLTAAKTVNGAEPREDQVFTFELLDAADNVLQTKQNVKGEIIFDALHYTLEDAGKSFLYKVREKQEEKPGYTTDSTVYTVAVWVIDNGDGTLKVTKAITSGDKLKDAITFNNTYEAKGEWTPTAAKTINGAEPREDQVYEFTLTDAQGNTILAENEKGDITFAPLTYDLSDAGKTYTYTVKETTASTDLLETDGSIYTVDVTVTDNKDGTLAVKPVITKDGAEVEEITFENKLTTVLSISKKVTGVETAETFAFTVKLYNADGTEATGEYAYTGDAKGKIKSGDTIELTHGQRVTISGLLPGMSYTVTEAASAAFETTVNGNAGNSIDGTLAEESNEAAFVNKFRTTMFMVKKSWQGGGGGAIELTLYANGEKLEPQPAYTRSEDVYVYSGLPMYDEQEQLIVYSAKEKYVDGFLTIYDNVAPYQDETKAIYHGGTIINKAIVKADFSVKKEWSGLTEGETAPEITLVLYCNGEATDVKTPDPDRNGWYKYYDLPGEVDGVKAVYTVKELPIEGYMTGYTLADGISAEYADNNGTITNTKIPQTGDEAPLAMWLSLMGASAMMLMLLLKRRKA